MLTASRASFFLNRDKIFVHAVYICWKGVHDLLTFFKGTALGVLDNVFVFIFTNIVTNSITEKHVPILTMGVFICICILMLLNLRFSVINVVEFKVFCGWQEIIDALKKYSIWCRMIYVVFGVWARWLKVHTAAPKKKKKDNDYYCVYSYLANPLFDSLVLRVKYERTYHTNHKRI